MSEGPGSAESPSAHRLGAGLLSAEQLLVGHGGTPVCAPVDLLLPPGRALAVVGPNGAGKSTLLQTLTGLLAPLSGRVRFAGRDVDERSADFRRAVATVLDEDAFFPALSGREHLLLTARALPSAWSSGQRRRLALAAAFVRPARLVVLDEPERRLDTGMRARLARRLADRRDDGTALLFASHDADLVDAVADEVLVVDDEAARLVDPAGAAAYLAGL